MDQKQIDIETFSHKFLPAQVKSDKLMIVLHGRGDSLKPFSDFHNELSIPEMNYLLLNAPRKYLDGFSWYGEPPYLEKNVESLRIQLFKVLRKLETQGWKSENIFLLGFSQGCLVSADIALNYPKKLAGVIGISGYFHFFPRWKSKISKQKLKTPWLFTHGRRDKVLSIEDTRFGVEKLKGVGFDVKWIESNKKHVFEEKEYPLIREWVHEKIISTQITATELQAPLSSQKPQK